MINFNSNSFTVIKWKNIIIAILIPVIIGIISVAIMNSDNEVKAQVPETTVVEPTETVETTKSMDIPEIKGNVTNYGTIITNNGGTVNITNHNNFSKPGTNSTTIESTPVNKVTKNETESGFNGLFRTFAVMICVLGVIATGIIYIIKRND